MKVMFYQNVSSVTYAETQRYIFPTRDAAPPAGDVGASPNSGICNTTAADERYFLYSNRKWKATRNIQMPIIYSTVT